MASPAPATTVATCARCGGAGALRCGSCRTVHYCGRDCQKAAWPEHKALCKAVQSRLFKGEQLTSERGFVREYWAELLPPGCDASALLGPPGEPFDAAAAFERCQAAAMDTVFPGWSRLSESQRGAYDVVRDLARLAAARARGGPARSGADLAVRCIDRFRADALDKLLSAGGVKPGDVPVACGGRSLFGCAFLQLSQPYPQSAGALPHALAMLRVVLAHAQPRDWLDGGPVAMPLDIAASISEPAVSQAVLDVILASPGGFPAHAVAATPGLLLHALASATPAFVKALLAAGADATSPAPLQYLDSPDSGLRARWLFPLQALAFSSVKSNSRDCGDKVRLLLDAGADLEATGELGWTALVEAAMREHAAAFDALLAAGARASALRVNLWPDAAHFATVLHQLVSSNNASLITRVLATRALDANVRAGPAHDRATPLLMAVSHDAPRSVSALLAGGASLAATTPDGSDALQFAIECSSAKAARPLVEATPQADRARYARDAAMAVAARARNAAARPGDAAAAAKLAAARAIAALLVA